MCLRPKEETGKLEELRQVCLGVCAGPEAKQRSVQEAAWKEEQAQRRKGFPSRATERSCLGLYDLTSPQ